MLDWQESMALSGKSLLMFVLDLLVHSIVSRSLETLDILMHIFQLLYEALQLLLLLLLRLQ